MHRLVCVHESSKDRSISVQVFECYSNGEGQATRSIKLDLSSAIKFRRDLNEKKELANAPRDEEACNTASPIAAKKDEAFPYHIIHDYRLLP